MSKSTIIEPSPLVMVCIHTLSAAHAEKAGAPRARTGTGQRVNTEMGESCGEPRCAHLVIRPAGGRRSDQLSL
jgi:hypothetical protein